jgi:hypothetical protein
MLSRWLTADVNSALGRLESADVVNVVAVLYLTHSLMELSPS